jgi:membrane-bound lytic murein transglycosylase B
VARAGSGSLALAAALLLGIAPCGAEGVLAPEVESFLGEMVQKHGFDRAALRKLFGQVRVRADVLRAVAAPVTALPWYEFRERFVDASRIEGGVRFWRENVAALERARLEFGVAPEIIVATIGVETLYGRRTGRHRVLDALATLAFHYPPRSEFFRGELEHYLLLARELRLDVARTRGSYAGAIGVPQFLPSSYRRYAVDFDRDGRADLLASTADAIGSVANYYRAHGWRDGEPVAVPADVSDPALLPATAGEIRPRLTVGELKAAGVTPLGAVNEEVRAALFAVETESGPRYWLGFDNFYVITRYNRSVNYALAVHEIARELRLRVGSGS